MGICCSKKLNVVHPLQNDGQRKPPTHRRIENLSEAILVFGRYERTLRARQFHPYDSHTMTKPTVSAGTLWKDRKFSFVIEQDKKGKRVKLSWKRPTEYATEIRLFDATINRYSVKQGQVSDCFFMNVLSAIADYPEYIKQIMPADAYDPLKSNGVFHCRFWWMGEWIDVYTDDLLPYNEDIERVYAGYSQEKNIVWVPLIEKALARLCGSYQAVTGDQSSAYTLMTGGLVEKLTIIKREEKDETLPPDTVFARVKQALNSGSTVLTGIDEKEEKSSHLKGLVAHHAYNINAAVKVQQNNGATKLLRMRNPWGEKSDAQSMSGNGDWKGRWSYGSSEWKEVSDDLRKQYNVEFEKGGEFWVCMEDFYKIFECIYIADTIPHFDEDGFRKSDKLNKVINILGEWHGETAAGDDMKHKFKNPRFLLTIPDQGLNRDRQMPVLLEIIQQHKHPVNDTDDKDQLYCHINVFRIDGDEVRDNRLHMCLNDISIKNVYMGGRENDHRYKLSPGKYMLVPNYLVKDAKPPVSRSFCMRVFTATDVECRNSPVNNHENANKNKQLAITNDREFMEYPVAMTGEPCQTFENVDGSLKDEARAVNVFGEWKGETAAGCESVNRLKNPRFILTIPENRKAKIHLQLRSRVDIVKTLHCRLDVFKIDADAKRSNRRWMLLNKITNMETFMGGGEVSYDYELAFGKYLLLPNYMEEERINSAFCIRILSFIDIQCGPQKENPVVFIREAENSLEYGNQSFKLEKIDFVFGEWVQNLTAGGQISHDSFTNNPQYGMSVIGNVPQPVLIDLLQETVEPIHAVGCHIIQINEDQHLPVDRDVIRGNAKVKTSDGKTSDGETHPFMYSAESSGHYMLPPGRYLVLVYADKPTDEKRFALVIAAQKESKIRLIEPK